MKKILLINPPVSIYINKTAFIPLPLLVLGTCLNNIQKNSTDFSHEVVDLDFMLKKGVFSDDSSFYEKAGDLILGHQPDVVLFTVHCLNHIILLKLSAIIKQERPACVIIVGGVGPTLTAKEALGNCADIDIIVKGEAEPVLKHLIPAALNNKVYTNVPSIAYRQNGRVLDNPRTYLSMDEPIPSPDFSLVPVEDYIAHNQTHPYIHPGFVLIESGRGCPNRCTFCAPAKMWESRVRYRPVQEIISEMTFLAQKGGNFSFFTQDNLEEHFLRELSEALVKDNASISWGCYSRLDRLSENVAALLAKAGCRMIFTGFETPNRSAQKAIRKVLNTSAAFQKLQHFNTCGISFIGSFIAGFTDETEEDLNRTMNFAIACATGRTTEQLDDIFSKTDLDKLPQKGTNICSIHPLAHMPGTDSFERERDHLHISRYSLHPDCYGSHLFGYDEFKDDLSYLGGNPYLNHLPEDQVRYYCSILRLFNFLNSRPYYFALFLSEMKLSPVACMQKMVADLGEEFVLTAKIDLFEDKSRAYVLKHLPYAPEWTVKKGQ